MNVSAEQMLTLRFPAQDVARLLQFLAVHPFRDVSGLMREIERQTERQIAELRQAPS